jgi:hypothetical protein
VLDGRDRVGHARTLAVGVGMRNGGRSARPPLRE